MIELVQPAVGGDDRMRLGGNRHESSTPGVTAQTINV